MSCILNINRFIIPNDVIVALSEVYKFIGKNDYYKKAVGNDKSRVIEQTIERDCYFLAKILKVNLTDTRMRLIITKDSSPRTKEEYFLFNLKETLATCQYQNKTLSLLGNDLINIANFLYPGQNIRFQYTTIDKKSTTQNTHSKRIDHDEINNEVTRIITTAEYEKIIVGLNYFIDFYNLSIFTEGNEVLSFILLYIVLLRSELACFSYVSLFEFLYKDLINFTTELKNASFNWHEGYAQSLSFVRFMIKLIISAYQHTNEIIKDFIEDQNINKADNVENTITKLPNVFTKEDIRAVHPYISESTINRALNKLKDDNAIKPLNKGRSAKWIKL